MSAEVKVVRDENHIPDLREILDELRRTEIHVGIFGKDDSHILMIANVNEFGTTIKPRNAKRLAIPLTKRARGKSPRQFNDLFSLRTENGNVFLVRNKGSSGLEFMYWLAKEVKIPERAFMRGGFDANKQAFENKAVGLLKKVFRRELELSGFFAFMGEYMVGSIQRYLTQLSDPPNSNATTSAKGKSNPLIDTGRLRNAITYNIVKKYS